MAITISGVHRAGSGAGGGWPTASTTGTSGTLTNSATDTFNTSGATHSNMNFTSTGTITVNGDNVTFNNCKFNGHLLVNEVDTCTLNDCEFVPPSGASACFSISSSRNVTLLRAKIENWLADDAIHITNDGTSFDNEDITIRDCYVYNADTTSPEAHSDGMQVRGSLRLTVDHNYIDLGPVADQHNAAFYLENAAPGGPNTDWLVENNYFKTGHGFTLYIHSAGGAGTFRDNTIAPGDFGYQFQAAPADVTDSGNVDELGNPYDVQNPPS